MNLGSPTTSRKGSHYLSFNSWTVIFVCKGYSCWNHWNKLINVLPLPYTNHNINMLNACNAKHNSEAQLKFDSAQLLQHVPQTRPYPARKLYKVFKCKLVIHHPHLASSNLDAKVFSANSKIFTSCNWSFAIAHALMKQVGLGKPAILFDKKNIPARDPKQCLKDCSWNSWKSVIT